MPDPDYFTLQEFRDLPDMDSSTDFSDEQIVEAAAYITGVLEREVGTSFILREKGPETFDGGGEYVTLDPWAKTLVSVVEGGIDVTSSCWLRAGVLRKRSGMDFLRWTEGLGNLIVTYRAGYSATPPADVKEQVMRGTRAHLVTKADGRGMSGRETGITTDMGGTINYAIAGPDRPTGYPEVDAMIAGYKRRLDVFGFA